MSHRTELLNKRFAQMEKEREALGDPPRYYEMTCDTPGCTTSARRDTIPELAAATMYWEVADTAESTGPDTCPPCRFSKNPPK